ncbi:MAG: DUF305 domain-containing protein, partial [Gemmatimonadota bacterium]|nr:DUF305 domain-containing protein [Gemmatimonadota bacterium]
VSLLIVGLALLSVAVVGTSPAALAFTMFETVRSVVSLAVEIGRDGPEALVLGFGELRYGGRAVGAPGAVETALSRLELGVPLLAFVWVLRRFPEPKRARSAGAAFLGLAAGLALWILVVGPRVLPDQEFAVQRSGFLHSPAELGTISISGLMRRPLLVAAILLVACGSTGETPRATATPDPDVAFMRGMIHHHAQAVQMARMAPTNDASPRLRTLAARILVSQRDEIALMQEWLRDRGEPAPRVTPSGELESGRPLMRMPGMLTDEQMAELEAARGYAFDLLFLTTMIEHHQGAVTMVEELFDSYGAAQGDAVFRLASDILSDQTSEIDRMRTMLRERMFETSDSP